MEATTRFNITGVQLRDYRSIARCKVALGRITLLVGPNGSGKSNFVDSLRFVSQALSETLDSALRDRGGVSEVRRRSTGHPRHFTIDLTFDGDSASGNYQFSIGAVRGGDYRVTHESCQVNSQVGEPLSHFVARDGRIVDTSLPGPMPKLVEDRLGLVALSGFEEFRPVFDGLTGMNVFNLNPESMRELQKPDPGDLLRRDGANVASVLDSLKRNHLELKEVIEEYLRKIIPGIESADRRSFGAWESIEFRQRVAGSPSPWSFQATSMSDGTLRALGVLVALFAPSAQNVLSPVAIEEPESALHPGAAGVLLDALRRASELRQVLATTHSPELLDSESIEPDSLLAVRSIEGRTEIGKVGRASIQAIKDRLYTPGELLRVDQLAPEVSSGQDSLFS